MGNNGTTPVGLPERLRARSPSSGRFGLGGLFAEYARLYAAIEEVAGEGYRWCLVRGDEVGDTPRAAHLAMFYGQLFSHLADSHLEQPSAYEFARSLTGKVSKSRLQWVTDV